MTTLYELERAAIKNPEYEHQEKMHKLTNLSWHQKDLLIRRGVHIEELKQIWRDTWGIEYPYISDMNDNVFKVGG